MRAKRERGAVTLEFALVLPLLAVLLFGLLYAGLYTMVGGLAQNAAREAARFASVPMRHSRDPVYPTGTQIAARARDMVPSWAAGDVVVDVSDAGAELPGSVVTVTLSYTGIPLFEALDGLLEGVGLDVLTDVTRAASARRE